jgi:D-ribulokinase
MPAAARHCAQDLTLGIDVGTTGVRIAALNGAETVVAQAHIGMAAAERMGSAVTQDAQVWWRATQRALAEIGRKIDLSRVRAVAVDGTSGTVLAIDRHGVPLSPARMYNDQCDPQIGAKIARLAQADSAAHGMTSPLARAIELQPLKGIARIVHQADWIAGCLSGQFGITDENNALKTGYDPVLRVWPEWIAETGMDPQLLPAVVPAGTLTCRSASRGGLAYGFAADIGFYAGTTDGCAAFLATGADRAGDAVTSLGSTLVLKLLSRKPLFAPAYGLYSHRIGDFWLAGGASNSGGSVLAQYFSSTELAELEAKLDADRPTQLDYYPLPAPGERFPIADPDLQPRLRPRPAEDAVFLQGLLEGIAAIEALGYRRLAELGGPPLISVRAVGGGARNTKWTQIRSRALQVPFLTAMSEEAAVGTALLALRAHNRTRSRSA